MVLAGYLNGSSLTRALAVAYHAELRQAAERCAHGQSQDGQSVHLSGLTVRTPFNPRGGCLWHCLDCNCGCGSAQSWPAMQRLKLRQSRRPRPHQQPSRLRPPRRRRAPTLRWAPAHRKLLTRAPSPRTPRRAHSRRRRRPRRRPMRTLSAGWRSCARSMRTPCFMPCFGVRFGVR